MTWNTKQPETSPTVREQPRVLLVDDDNSIVTILKILLTKAGFECHVARNGYTGFDMACSLLPDLMIIDVNMPNRNGFEVLEMLRQHPETANMRTIMLTACEEKEDIRRGLGLGADDYVTKPFDPKEIAARVKSVLSRP